MRRTGAQATAPDGPAFAVYWPAQRSLQAPHNCGGGIELSVRREIVSASFDLKLEALPSKEPGVHRPGTGTEEGQSETQHSNHHRVPPTGRMREHIPERAERN